MNVPPTIRMSIIICLAVAAILALNGVDVGLVMAVILAWTGSLWLARPLPEAATERRERNRVIPEEVPLFLEQVGAPLLIARRDRVVVANLAARNAFGAHVVDQDLRVGLRHPDVVALIDSGGEGCVTVRGLTTARSLWQVHIADLGMETRLLELTDISAQSDIARAHTDFVANASHELRTPLASVIGYIETLKDTKAGSQAETRDTFLSTMEREARRMGELVDDLMSLSRIEAEKHDAPQDQVALLPLVRAVAADVAVTKGVERVVVESVGEDAVTRGDRSQLDQLIRNLIDNALKYGDPAHPVTIKVDDKAQDAITLRVVDTGPGIAKEHIPHLTRRFYRTDPGRSRAAGGTGLGLAIVKHIVERHKGELDIASTPGKGTTVTVTLPHGR